MLLPFFLRSGVLAKVALERLLAPGAIDGVCDRRKGADGFVFAGVAEELPSLLTTAFIHMQRKGKGGRTRVRAP